MVGNGTWNPGLILDTTRLGLPGRTAAPEVDPPTSTTPGPGRNSRQSGLAVPGPGRVWVMELGRNGLKTRTVHRRPARTRRDRSRRSGRDPFFPNCWGDWEVHPGGSNSNIWKLLGNNLFLCHIEFETEWGPHAEASAATSFGSSPQASVLRVHRRRRLASTRRPQWCLQCGRRTDGARSVSASSFRSSAPSSCSSQHSGHESSSGLVRS